MDTKSVMTCGHSRSNACITQALKRRPAILSALAGRIRNNLDFQPPKSGMEHGTILFVCMMGFNKIGAVLDGGEVIERAATAITTFDFPGIANWTTTNFIALAVLAIFLWTVRSILGPPTRWLLAAVHKWWAIANQ